MRPNCLSAVALLAIAPIASAQLRTLTFEEAPLVAMPNVLGISIPLASRLSDQFVTSHGIRFLSGSDFVAVVVHNAPTVSPPNIIGGSTGQGSLTYNHPIVIEFRDTANPARPGVTDYVKIRGDGMPLGVGTIAMLVQDPQGAQLARIDVPDVGPPGTSATLEYAGPGVSRVILSSNNGTIGFDQLEFETVEAASLGSVYCASVPNSTGNPGAMGARGSAAVVANALRLDAWQLPVGSFGFFLTSLDAGLVMNPGGSQGILCLGGAIGRYVGPGQVQNAGMHGAIALQIDLARHPTPTGPIAVQPGDTWRFQAWYRDLVGGISTSNFTDGIVLQFI